MAEPIHITDKYSIDATELKLSYIRSSGPGGQNVNKLATAAQLRFDLSGSPSLPQSVKSRAGKLAGNKLTNDGILIITASSFRTQPQNRQDAISRLVALLQKAAIPPKHRRKTRPTLASKRARIDAKTKRGSLKNLRRNKPDFD